MNLKLSKTNYDENYDEIREFFVTKFGC